MNHLVINAWQKKSRIAPEIYGHFLEQIGGNVYHGGIYVGRESKIPNQNGIRLDMVEAFKKIKVPVIRWPGGCYAEKYHWKNGIGPLEKRPMRNLYGRFESHEFGSHEFMELCELVGCEAYLGVNMGSGTVQEMTDWIDYLTVEGDTEMSRLRKANGREKPWPVKYWGIGNENWGCGGHMSPEYYANMYNQYSSFAGFSGGPALTKIACGPGDDEWTDVVMKLSHHRMEGLALHKYTDSGSIGDKGQWPATGFTVEQYYAALNSALGMDKYLDRQIGIMNHHDPEGRVGVYVDEWGAWYDAEPGTSLLYQQSTMRDAIIAAIHLNIFNKHSDRVQMACLAQAINVLQAIIMTAGEAMWVTPTYHVFDLYKYHQGGRLLDSSIDAALTGGDYPVPSLHESASQDADGNIHVTVTNLSVEKQEDVQLILLGQNTSMAVGEMVTGGMDDYNTAAAPDDVAIQPFTDYVMENGQFTMKLPPCSVVHLTLMK